MKKHRYSAQTEDRRIVFGIDVAKDDFYGVLMQEDLSVIATLKWIHPQQTRELEEGDAHEIITFFVCRLVLQNCNAPTSPYRHPWRFAPYHRPRNRA